MLASSALRDALLALAADPPRWRALSTPGVGDGVAVEELDAALLDTLAGAGIVEIAGDRVGPRLPVVLRRGRPYLMSLRPGGEGDPYVQDLWPETDALLARVAGAPPGTLLEVGTGSGAVAIEAALGGHTATGTDLFGDTLELAAWNAALHGVSLELLRGHMLEPTRGRRFDLVVSAPHYGQHADLLRVEMLREGITQVAPGGALFVVTYLDWEGDRVGVVEQLLRPMAARGASVTVGPFPRGPLARWFHVPTPATPGIPARHRFAIEIRPDGPAALDVRLPGDHEIEREPIVPLARRSPRAATATVATAADLAALDAILAELATGTLRLEAPLMLLDACRFGAERCVNAHGAIVDAAGARPCAHGARLGDIDDTARSFHARMLARLADVERVRGVRRAAPSARAARTRPSTTRPTARSSGDTTRSSPRCTACSSSARGCTPTRAAARSRSRPAARSSPRAIARRPTRRRTSSRRSPAGSGPARARWSSPTTRRTCTSATTSSRRRSSCPSRRRSSSSCCSTATRPRRCA